MSDDFLSRWSRRKIEARKGAPADPMPAQTAQPAPKPAVPVETGAPPEPKTVLELPPIDSLTIDSDFSPFMQAGVDPALKREALRKLVRDPRFNVMDGLDVYIDDYSKPDPLPEGWLEKLNQMKGFVHGVEAEKDDAAALQNPVQEHAVETKSASDSSDAANKRPDGPSVTEGGSTGGTLPRNEA